MTRPAGTVALGELTTWLSGGTPNRAIDSYWNGTIPWISAVTLQRSRVHESNQHLTDAGVRAGSRMAPVGASLILVRGMSLHRETRIGMADRPVSFNQDIKAVVPKAGLTPEFLLYSLQARSAQIRDLVSVAGSGTGVLNTQLLQRLPIWVPDRATQERVVLAIGVVDRQIEALERMIVTKREMRQGMMQQLLTGRTRLAGFVGEWDTRPFRDVLRRINARTSQVPASSYQPAGRLPVVDQGQQPIVGYTDDMAAEFDPGDEGVVVFGDHTCIAKFVNFPFAIGADGTQLIKALPGQSTAFFAYALKVDPVASRGYNRHFKDLREKTFAVPSRREQDAIVAVLEHCDEEVACLDRRLTKATSVRQGMLREVLVERVHLPSEKVAA